VYRNTFNLNICLKYNLGAKQMNTKAKKPAETKESPPKVISVSLSLGINEVKWKQYQEEGYTDAQIEGMLKADIERAISRGSFNTNNKLINGIVITIDIGKYY
jgi:hypothetical protein